MDSNLSVLYEKVVGARDCVGEKQIARAALAGLDLRAKGVQQTPKAGHTLAETSDSSFCA